MTLGNMRDLGVPNLRAEAERKAIVDAQEIVAIWNAERVMSQFADREPPPVAFLSWDRTAERTGTRRAIPPNHKMNVVRCTQARLGFGASKKGKGANVRDDLFPISRGSLPHVGSRLFRSFCQGRISSPRA
jgi:hypothetical protein